MTSESYKQALAQAQIDLSSAVQERAKWTREVARLEQLIRSLAAMALKTEKTEEVTDLVGLQELVFTAVCSSPVPVTAMEIRDWLANLGYNINKYRNPMAVIHSALNRLQKAGQILRVGGLGKYAAVALIKPRRKK